MQEQRLKRETRNLGILAAWTVAWAGSLALAKFGPDVLWHDNPVVSWIAVAINLALGIGWIVAHARYLRGVDDLQRKVMMDAIALALGVGVVVGFSYSVASTAGLVWPVNIAFLSILMSVVYLGAIVAGNVRYR